MCVYVGGVYPKIHNIYHPQTLHPQQPCITNTRCVSLSEAVTWKCGLRYFCTGSGLYREVTGKIFPTGRGVPVPGGSRSNLVRNIWPCTHSLFWLHDNQNSEWVQGQIFRTRSNREGWHLCRRPYVFARSWQPQSWATDFSP